MPGADMAVLSIKIVEMRVIALPTLIDFIT